MRLLRSGEGQSIGRLLPSVPLVPQGGRRIAGRDRASLALAWASQDVDRLERHRGQATTRAGFAAAEERVLWDVVEDCHVRSCGDGMAACSKFILDRLPTSLRS